MDEWIKLNDEVKYRSEESIENTCIDLDPEKMFESIDSDELIIKGSILNLDKELTPEYISGINSLIDFSPRGYSFSETYITIYENELKKVASYPGHFGATVKEKLIYSNSLENILRSLFFLNYSSVAERIIERYEVSNSFHWIAAAKSGRLFEKPSYCGY